MSNKNLKNNKNSKNHKNSKNNKKSINPLLPVSIAVLAVALILVATDFPSRFKKSTNTETVNTETANETGSVNTGSGEININDNGDVVIQEDSITKEASFYEYDYNGTTVGLFAVKASDGTIRTALNTCQVCNGSPYAFFEQQSDKFQCQNCGNLFSLDMIGQERGGCNPIPIIGDEREESGDGTITIPADFIKDNASIFTNWKKY